MKYIRLTIDDTHCYVLFSFVISLDEFFNKQLKNNEKLFMFSEIVTFCQCRQTSLCGASSIQYFCLITKD